jgi:hypothetical protein
MEIINESGYRREVEGFLLIPIIIRCLGFLIITNGYTTFWGYYTFYYTLCGGPSFRKNQH